MEYSKSTDKLDIIKEIIKYLPESRMRDCKSIDIRWEQYDVGNDIDLLCPILTITFSDNNPNTLIIKGE